jgi:uncharacterized protein (DUF1800 family)
MRLARTACPIVLFAILGACATHEPASAPETGARGDPLSWLNRVSFGATTSSAGELGHEGQAAFLQSQLHPGATRLPEAISAQIDALTISQSSMVQLATDLESRRRDADALKDPDQKKTAQQAYQQELNRLGREAQTRSLLRDVYSNNQLQEQMTWFWMNHFNVHMYKSNIRVLVGDYEEHAIRAHALGRFRDLLEATVRHPAMLRYLDNEQNAAGHINENFARELMELHTLGVDGGYTQRDVQELARILTGVGVNFGPNAPKLKPELQRYYVRDGLFEFNPARHDFGDKQFLGHTIHGGGMAEVDSALDILAREPATARFISRQLALYFVSDEPTAALVERMSATYRARDGDIAAVLATLFESPEFRASLGAKFKDPLHYVVSAVRLAYDQKPILNAQPMNNWLNRMGEPLYAHETPDGYPLTQVAWASPGQMTTRFEIAKAIGSGSAGLFKTDGPQPLEQAAFPQLSNALYFASIERTLSPATRQALDQANSPQEWNTFLLASPEFMNR